MKVAITTHLFPVDAFPGGGVQSATYYLCKALAAHPDIALVVVRPLSRKEDLGRVVYDGIKVMPLEYRLCYSRSIGLLWTQVRQVRQALALVHPDIVHVQDSSLLGLLVSGPSVFTLHGQVERDARYMGRALAAHVRSLALHLTYGLARRWIRNVIAVSPYTASVLPPSKRRRVWIVPNAVGDGFFDLVASPSRRTILYVGHMTPLKNVQGLIRGFAGLAAACPEAELRLTGADSPYGQDCRRLVAALGLDARVRFLGALDMRQVQQELGRASLVALCSLQENAPMCIAEAMAAGVPVVASRRGGIPWMLEDGRCGTLIDDPMVPAQITAAMRQALVPECWCAMSKAARQRAEMFRASRVAEQTVAVYREILGK